MIVMLARKQILRQFLANTSNACVSSTHCAARKHAPKELGHIWMKLILKISELLKLFSGSSLLWQCQATKSFDK